MDAWWGYFIGRLIDWWSDWFFYRSIDWLIDWLVDWLTDCFFYRHIDSLIHWFLYWQIDRFIDFFHSQIDWMVFLLANWFIDSLVFVLTDRLIDWFLYWQVDWLIDWLILFDDDGLIDWRAWTDSLRSQPWPRWDSFSYERFHPCTPYAFLCLLFSVDPRFDSPPLLPPHVISWHAMTWYNPCLCVYACVRVHALRCLPSRFSPCSASHMPRPPEPCKIFWSKSRDWWSVTLAPRRTVPQPLGDVSSE